MTLREIIHDCLNSQYLLKRVLITDASNPLNYDDCTMHITGLVKHIIVDDNIRFVVDVINDDNKFITTLTVTVAPDNSIVLLD